MLTDRQCRAAKPAEKDYKLADGEGLYLLVRPNGSKLWKQKYRFEGREKKLSHGPYPEVSLGEARDRKTDARRLLRQGVDPGVAGGSAGAHGGSPGTIGAPGAGMTVSEAYWAWFAKERDGWTTRYQKRVALGHDQYIKGSTIEKLDVREVKAADLRKILEEVESESIHKAHDLRAWLARTFAFAVAFEACETNPALALKGVMKRRPPVQNRARLSEDRLGEFFWRLDHESDATEQTKLAIELTILTTVRTKELREAQRDGEFDLDAALWRIPADRMKMRRPHTIPLVPRAVEIVKRLRELSGGPGFLIKGVRVGRPMSENTMLFTLYRMGYKSEATMHGFRGVFSTICHEQGFRSVVIEAQLAHADDDKVRASYNAATYLEERRELLEWWATFLAKERAAGVGLSKQISEVTPFAR